MPNLQGGHQAMDMRMGKLNTRPKLVEILITDIVINSVQKMVKDQGFKLLKIYTQKKKNGFPYLHLEGVDHQQK